MGIEELNKSLEQAIIQQQLHKLSNLIKDRQTSESDVRDILTIYGHRGVGPTSKNYQGEALPHGVIPENSILAFEHAFLNKAKGIELDVLLTLDEEVVVCHDNPLAMNVDRYHRYIAEKREGEGPYPYRRKDDLGIEKLLVSEVTLEELQKYYPVARGQYIPTLDQVISCAFDLPKDLVRPDLIINIELQAKSFWDGASKELLAQKTFDIVVKAIETNPNLHFKNFLITAFDEFSLFYMRKLYDQYLDAHPKFDKTDRLQLSLGLYTDNLYGSKDQLGPSWTPIQRYGKGSQEPVLSNHIALPMLKQKMDQKYLEDTLSRMIDEKLDAVDLSSGDIAKDMIDACKKKGLMIVASIHDGRVSAEILLRHPELLSYLEITDTSDITTMGKGLEEFYVRSMAFTSEQINLYNLLQQQKFISRDLIEIYELTRILIIAIEHNLPITYKADNVRLANETIQKICEACFEPEETMSFKSF